MNLETRKKIKHWRREERIAKGRRRGGGGGLIKIIIIIMFGDF
jgi:hypothetical protein